LSLSQISDDFVAPKCEQQIKILYREKRFLVIDKPSGLLSLSGKNPLNQDSVHFRLTQEFPSAMMVHRLDLGTSGLMLVALDKPSNANLAGQFSARSISKTYMSLLDGLLNDDEGQVDAPIAKDASIFPRVNICAKHGKQAYSDYRVIERLTDALATRVRFSPSTGRTHQLRVHSQHLGHPILGCDLYGTKRSYQAASRLMLHAESLAFNHPTSGQRMLFECASPF